MPVYVSSYAPKTFSGREYMLGLFNLNFYISVDSLAVQMKRLDEVYAETVQTGFIVRYGGDGMPGIEDAFVRLKLKS